MQMMPPPGAPPGAHVVYMQPPPGAPQAVYMQPPPGAHYPPPPPQQQPAGMFPAPGQMLMQAAQRRAPAMFGTGQPTVQQHPPQPGR